MKMDNEYFTPDDIDAQIEQLQQTGKHISSPVEAQLVDALKGYYQHTLTESDQTALKQARQRITGQQNDKQSNEDDTWITATGKMQPIQPAKRSRTTRFPGILRGLAAMLIVGTLIASWLAVTHIMHPAPAVQNSSKQDLFVIHSGIAYRIDGSTGKVIWQQTLPAKKLPDTSRGRSAALQVVNHVAYAMFDYDIFALNTTNGKQIWHISNPSKQAYFNFVVDNNRLYLYSLDLTFSALDASDGHVLWHNTTFKTENGYDFSVVNGNLYIQKPTSDPQDQKLYSLDGTTGSVRWNYSLTMGSMMEKPLFADGILYLSSGRLLSAIKDSDGRQLWQTNVPTTGQLGSFYLANSILYANSWSTIESSTDTNKIFALDIHNGKLLWASNPGYQKLATSIIDGLLLAQRQHDGKLSIEGLNPNTGKVVWQVPFTCGIQHMGTMLLYPQCSIVWTGIISGNLSLLVSDNQASAGQPLKMDYTLKSFDPHTGQLLSDHKANIKQDSVYPLGASNGLLYLPLLTPRIANTISYTDVTYAAYKLSDGTFVWEHTMPPFPAPTSANTSPDTSQPVLAAA